MAFSLANKQSDSDALLIQSKVDLSLNQNNTIQSNITNGLTRPNFLTIKTEKADSTPIGCKYTKTSSPAQKTSPLLQKEYATTGTNTDLMEAQEYAEKK